MFMGGNFRKSAKKRLGFIFVSLIFTNQALHVCARVYVRARTYIESGMHTRRVLITVDKGPLGNGRLQRGCKNRLKGV